MKRLLWIVAVVTVAVCSTVPIIDPDIWWHITVGKWILAHSTVPHVDYWNMFWAGKPWRAYSWLCEVLFALVERGWGDHGLLSLKLCVAVLYCATLSAVFGRIARDYFLGTAVGFLVLCASAGNFTLRPQCLVWILFVLLFGLADTISREGLNTKRTAALFAVMMLWANLHITTILGLGTLAGWIARPGRWKVAAQSVGIAFVGTLFTPYFGGEWLTFRETAVHPVSFAAIAEFQPATILQYSTGLLALLGGMVWAIGGDRSARAYPLRFMLTGAL